MSIIKQHILRIYIYDKGYALYSGTLDRGFRRQNLDVASDYVSSSYIQAQNRLDEILETRKVTWSMSFCNDAIKRNPIVAYGTLRDIPDSHGLSSIFFIHAIELYRSVDLYLCVKNLIRVLSNEGVIQLTKSIRDVAIGECGPDSLLKFASQRVEDMMLTNKGDITLPQVRKSVISSIEHDCAGASALAWLAMAFLHNSAEPPWEVFDLAGVSGGIKTGSTKYLNANSVCASDIQDKSIKQFVLVTDTDGQSITSESIVESGAAKNLSINNRVPSTALEGTPKKGNGIPHLASTIGLIFSMILVSACLFLLYIVQNQQRHTFDDLQTFSNNLKEERSLLLKDLNELIGSGKPVQPRELQDQPVSATVKALFDVNPNVRAAALSKLKQDKRNHSEVLPMILNYIRENPKNLNGVLNALLLLQEMDKNVLAKEKDNILGILDTVGTNGPKTAKASEGVRSRLNGE
jgi:hypothetical protein